MHDKLVVNGLVDIGTHTNFVGTLGYSTLPGGYSFTLIDNNLADPIAGLLNGEPQSFGNYHRREAIPSALRRRNRQRPGADYK